MATAVVEPYTWVLYTHTTHSGWAFLEDHQAICNLCHLISYINLDFVIVRVSLNTFIRFDGSPNVDLKEFEDLAGAHE